MDQNIPACPFCSFSDTDTGFLMQHIELCHPENGSSTHEFNAMFQQSENNNDNEASAEYLDCPHGCGEIVTSTEMAMHLDFHVAEGIAFNDRDGYSPLNGDLSSDQEDSLDLLNTTIGGKKGTDRDSFRTNTSKPSRTQSPPRTVGADGVKRLGRSELGPHAHEKKMPSWLSRMLEKGDRTTKQTQITADGKLSRHTKVENETDNLIPVIAKLCEQDKSVTRAFLCSPKVRHVCKMSREGGFCGYRNIQMLVSYIRKSQSLGHKHFSDGSPSILDLQNMIEHAWDMGFNSSGRTETGGIKGTRKFIGTPEAQALFQSLNIPCNASSFTESSHIRAFDSLFLSVAEYFKSACVLDEETKVFKTDLPPIYFQHQGHSMTIIGFEIHENGSANLLVFDPMFKTSPAMLRLIGTSTKSENPARLLKAYRRGVPYLQKYKMFEILRLCNPSPETDGDQ